MEERQRIIQEYVPGKQVTLAHLIAHPTRELCERLGIEQAGAIGILTITPGEGAIIAGDVATKAAAVSIAFLDRFSGAVVIYGDVASVETGLRAVNETLGEVLKFTPSLITRS
ncbi:BMC domain-containing protein [Symbiobacterium thermophilum]|uniref:Propanediol utilization protein n=1 Tax=Symbiobacterium thermophilum TaxID=2734 RepID=A0A953IAZ8_SYMTR|nr:BMC domain-containing protein [Symbiobacterium thermophilum]MBY6276881.1 propanediol utilization protein [Symbiobacterium thermophilum]